MELVNLTSHDIVLLDQEDNVIATFAAADEQDVARVSVEAEDDAYPVEIDGERTMVQFYHTEFGEVTGLPEEYCDVGLIVSSVVKLALPERTDLYTPFPLVRNERGQVIGSRGFSY